MEGDVDLDRSDQPADEMDGHSGADSDRGAVEPAQAVVEHVDGTQGAPLAPRRETVEKPLDQAVPAASLNDEEGRERRGREGETSRHGPDDRAVAGEPDEGREARDREKELRHRLCHQVDEHARTGKAAPKTAPCQQTSSHEVASDLRDGKQRVDAFAYEAQRHAVPQGRTIDLGKDHEPAETGPADRHDARRDDDQGTPTRAHDRGGHIIRPGGQEQADDRAQTDDQSQGRQTFHGPLSTGRQGERWRLLRFRRTMTVGTKELLGKLQLCPALSITAETQCGSKRHSPVTPYGPG